MLPDTSLVDALAAGLINDIACARLAGAATASNPATAASPKIVLMFIFMNFSLDRHANELRPHVFRDRRSVSDDLRLKVLA